jgi:hypothetical protein
MKDRELAEWLMEEKGYRLVSADQLPMKAKREAPQTSLDYRAKGVAGSLE